MSWINLNFKERDYSVSIKGVAKEFGLSKEYIINLLSVAGYNVFNANSFMLNNDHLEIVLSAYTDSLKLFYNKSSKNFYQYDRNKQESLIDFFKKFIQRGFFNNEVVFEINGKILSSGNKKIFNKNLDSELIRDYFFSKIREIEFREYIGYVEHDIFDLISKPISNSTPFFITRDLTWRLNINSLFNDIKSRIFTIIISGHYYIFTAEEDSITAFLTSIKRCFSAVKLALGEVFEINNSNFNPKWKITYSHL